MPTPKKQRKIFVLDTSVILHDHQALSNFQENDIAIPITVLEELDNFKRGNDTKNFEAREFIRMLDKLAENYTLQDWIPIGSKEQGKVKIVLFNNDIHQDAEKIFADKKADHRILNSVIQMQAEAPDAKVILVTKDINLRLKAKALNLSAEDYETGKVKASSEYTGTTTINDLSDELIKEVYSKGVAELPKADAPKFSVNGYYIINNGKSSLLAFYNSATKSLERVEKEYVYGIKPRNAEQAFAIHAMLNDTIRMVTLQGMAGTGKTLIALASAIEQRNKFQQIILARPIIPLSNRDIGYLPGDASEKINPYMQPLFDNLNFIKNQYNDTEKKYKQIIELQEEQKMLIQPLAFIRGRSFANTIFIIDEAQNLTPHEVKTIVTRAGENTKIIFTGDIRQIDTPYLDEHSNGLSYLIERFKGQNIYAHITLEKGERSELANLANELL